MMMMMKLMKLSESLSLTPDRIHTHTQTHRVYIEDVEFPALRDLL